MESTRADYELGGVVRERSGSVLPGVAPSNVYPTADGAEVVVAGNADAVFARLCQAMGQPELATDERFATHGARGDNMTELDELVGAWTSALPCEKLLAVLRSEEHTSELQSLMRKSYAVFCLKKKTLHYKSQFFSCT